jgi:hypothetical protein
MHSKMLGDEDAAQDVKEVFVNFWLKRESLAIRESSLPTCMRQPNRDAERLNLEDLSAE